MSRRGQIAQALDRLGVIEACLRARALIGWPRRGLTVLLYHRVTDPTRLDGLDPSLVDATPQDFDTQMALARRHFSPVALGDVQDAVTGGRPLPANALLVSFDDGYRDNLEVAVPILKRHGIRATFFVATGYMSERRLFWWERIAVQVRRATAPRLLLSYPAPLELELGDDTRRSAAVRRLCRTVKDHYDLDLDRFLADIDGASGVAWTEDDDRRYSQSAILDWDGVLALRDAGMDVASHTRGHRVLQTLRPDVLAGDLADSKAELERRLGQPVRAVAYPVGKRIHDHPAVREAVRAAGYDLGFVVSPGVNVLPAGGAPADGVGVGGVAQDRYDLKRIPVDRAWSLPQFRATLVHHAFA
jgi:peptidoglycan/xylan/chitin deacetylase (PgdA/CDA1 family)